MERASRIRFARASDLCSNQLAPTTTGRWQELPVRVRQRTNGMERQARHGRARHGWAWQGKAGAAARRQIVVASHRFRAGRKISRLRLAVISTPQSPRGLN